jgi:radical SAM protein with 4Fe4S-binding SPASM domain
MGNCASLPPNFEQDMPAVMEAVKGNRLLTMEIELSLRCNFSCPYCYVPKPDDFEDELAFDEVCNAVLQAKALGAGKIIILGGEPSIHPQVKRFIQFLHNQALEIEIFTNGTGVDASLATFFHDHDVRVVLKMNSFDRKLQDKISGKKGAYDIIQSALKNLKSAGYASNGAFLAVSTVICSPNIEELPRLWRWLRDQKIVPYFEMITPQANALDNQWLFVDSMRVYQLFKTLAEIDRRHYDVHWDPQPPLVGNRCLRHMFSCLVTSKGDVTPCVGINIPMGNLRQNRLEDILARSELIRKLKNYRYTIKGPCKRCEKAEQCYGCRGAAYQMTGDYLASDPLCWKNCQPHGSKS